MTNDNSILYEFRVRRIRRFAAKCATFPYETLTGPEEAAALLHRLSDESPQEAFFVLYLDVHNCVIGFERVAVGTLTSVDVHPREVFRGAILASAAAIIVGHNHPSGSARPSDDDYALTARLVAAGELLGIPVLDHLIVAPGDERFVQIKA